jgi:hypothetical protein
MNDTDDIPSVPEIIDREPDGSPLDEAFCTIGNSISADEAMALTKALEADEHDLKARLKLLGYYFKFQARPPQSQERQAHILWMIDNRPSDFVCGSPRMTVDGRNRPLYEEAKKHWFDQMEANPDNAAIAANAGSFFILVEPKLARDCLKRAVDMEPQNEHFEKRLKSAKGILRQLS